MEEIIYSFKGLGEGVSICRLAIDRNRNIVIVTELAENPGTSITNSASELANQVCDQFSLNKKRLVWIENYNKHSYSNGYSVKDCCSLVSFMVYGNKLTAPQWTHLEIKAEEYILGLS